MLGQIRRRSGGAHGGSPLDEPIVFEDAAVKSILVTNWGGADGGSAANNTRVNNTKVTGIAGEITYRQAESVINFGTVFKGNTTIEYFREMEYFTAMTLLPQEGFRACSNLKAVNLVNIVGQRGAGYHRCFQDCTSLYELGDTTNIEDLATGDFRNTAITEANMPKLVLRTSNTFIDELFMNCANLASVNMPILETVGISMFQNCPSLTYLKFPKVKTTKYLCFASSNITKIVLPDLETQTGNVYGSNTVIGIIIGDKLTSIAKEAFGGGYNIQVRYVLIKATTPPTCGTNILRYNNNPKIYVPDASVNAYKATTGFDTYVNNIYPISQFNTDFPGEYE